MEGQTQQSALQDMFRLAEFTHCVPAYESHSTSAAVAAAAAATVDANANASLAAPATSAVVAANVKQALLNQITQRVVHARNSEGKVLYFLDPEGRVLELLKFKTWWYIWRRSCRELVSSLFSRFYSASATATANAPVAFGRSNKRAMEQDAAEAERIAGTRLFTLLLLNVSF